MTNTTDSAPEKDPSVLGWWLVLIAAVIGSIALAYVLVNDRNAAEMHKGEGVVVAAPRSGH
jgi:hypothetical protein